MKRLLSLSLALLMALSLLTACGGGAKPTENPQPPAPEVSNVPEASKAPEKSPEELTQLYADAITANGGEMVQYNPVVSAVKEDDGSAMLLELLGLKEEDMEAFGISASMMNVKAYAIALVRPVQDKEDDVMEALQGFIELQKSNFERYLEDQYEIAKAARLETLTDGSILLVMCQDQDPIFDAIRDAVEKA